MYVRGAAMLCAVAITLGAASNALAADGEVETAQSKPAHRKFAVELNPLSMLIGRYGVQAEWLPALHHALVLNPHFDHVNAEIETSVGDQKTKTEQSFTGFGTELGYRFYTGQRGPNGFYVGPSLLVGTYSTEAGEKSVSFSSIGGALDIGGQTVLGNGIVLGGGFGLQYTSISEDFTDLPITAAIIAGGGVRPRFLFSAGYAF
jgi:hypothetical protein